MEKLTGKERRAKQKAQYDCYKVIKEKIEKGEPTTFQERTIYRIVEKKRNRSFKEIIENGKNLKYTNSKPSRLKTP